MQGTFMARERGTSLIVAPLNMQCDAKEIPQNPDGTKPVGWWLAGRCLFTGTAATEVFDSGLAEPQEVVVQGTAAIAVNRDRVLGIVSPDADDEPALWWAWQLSDLTIETSGEQGVFKKRPALIGLENGDGAIDIAVVSQLDRHSGSHKTGQEGSLLKALAAANA